MQIFVIDTKLSISDQLRRIADNTNIPLGNLINAWNEKDSNITSSQTVMRDFVFDLMSSKDEHFIDRRTSYQKQQKLLPKIFK